MDKDEFTASNSEDLLGDNYNMVDILRRVYNSFAGISEENSPTIEMEHHLSDTQGTEIALTRYNRVVDSEFHVRFQSGESSVVKNNDEVMLDGEMHGRDYDKISIISLHEKKTEYNTESIAAKNSTEENSSEKLYITKPKKVIEKKPKRIVSRRNPLIAEMVKSVETWRDSKKKYGTYIKAAEHMPMEIRMPKKTLDDYYTLYKIGKQHGFNFEEYKHCHIGKLREFARSYRSKARKSEQVKKEQIFRVIYNEKSE